MARTLSEAIAEGRRLIAEATKGKWQACDDEDGSPVICIPPDHGGPVVANYEGASGMTGGALFLTRADRDLIVFAASHLPALLDVAEAAAAYQEEMAAIGNGVDTALSAALSALGLGPDGEGKEKGK